MKSLGGIKNAIEWKLHVGEEWDDCEGEIDWKIAKN